MAFHKQGAYDGFHRLREVATHYKRCRKMQFFILHNDGVEADKPTCAKCKKPITVKQGNRCEFLPKGKKIVCYHYDCAWSVVMGQIYR